MAPLVTATPILIDPTNFSSPSIMASGQSPSGSLGGRPGVNPYVVSMGNGVLYAFLQDFNPVPVLSNPAGAWKSINGGASWTRMDAAHQPPFGKNLSVWYPGTGTTIFCAWTNNTNAILITSYSTATDTWGTASAAAGGITAQNGRGPFQLTGLSSGDLYVYLNPFVTGATKSPGQYMKYSGGVWSGPVDVTPNAASTYCSLLAVITDDGDRTHVIYEEDVLPSTTTLNYVQVDSSGIVGAPRVLANSPLFNPPPGRGTWQCGAPTISGNQLIVPIVSYSPLAPPVEIVNALVTNALFGPMLFTFEVVDPGGSTLLPTGSGAALYTGASTALVNNGIPYIFWGISGSPGGGDHGPDQIWMSSFQSGAWGAPVLVYDFAVSPPGSLRYGSGAGAYVQQGTVVATGPGTFNLVYTMAYNAVSGVGSTAGFSLSLSAMPTQVLVYLIGKKLYPCGDKEGIDPKNISKNALYSPPAGSYDLPFSWVFDASIFSNGSSHPNSSVYLLGGYGDFLLRRVVGLNRILAADGTGQFQIQRASKGSYIQSDPVQAPNSPELAIAPEEWYPETGKIWFDLFGIKLPTPATSAQLAFQGVRRQKGTLDRAMDRYQPKSYTYQAQASLTAIVGSPIVSKTLITDYDFELHQIMVMANTGSGFAPITTPTCMLSVFDQNKVSISNKPVLDIFYNGAPGTPYENGALVTPLYYKKDTILQINFYSLS